MTHIEQSNFSKDTIIVNDKALVIPFYNDFKGNFTTAEQKAIESYIKDYAINEIKNL